MYCASARRPRNALPFTSEGDMDGAFPRQLPTETWRRPTERPHGLTAAPPATKPLLGTSGHTSGTTRSSRSPENWGCLALDAGMPIAALAIRIHGSATKAVIQNAQPNLESSREAQNDYLAGDYSRPVSHNGLCQRAGARCLLQPHGFARTVF